eukprot:68496_1
MATLVSLVYISLATGIVSGQAIAGDEYTLRGTLYGKDDNTIEIYADQDGANLMELLNTTDGSELNGWYLESYQGVTLLTYWRTRSQFDNIYWDFETDPDIYPLTTYLGHTMHFRATFTANPTSGPTTSEPTQATAHPTTAAPTPATIAPTAVPSAAPTALVYLHEAYQLPSLGDALGLYDQYAIIGDDAGSAGPGIAYIFDLNTANHSYASLTPSDSSYDAFGWAVSISGDYAAISAPYKDLTVGWDTDYGYGSVYIYKRTTSNLWQQMTNFQPATNPGHSHFYFGQRVMMQGDYILVGTHMGDIAYVFKKEGEAWSEMAALTPDASINCCQWGDALNEMHLDNTASYALISYTFNSNTVVGQVFVFKRTIETWAQIDTLTSPSSDSGSYQFGRATAFYDDYIAITEHGNAVHIYTIDKDNSDTITLIQTLSASPDYGAPLAMYGDILSVSIYDENQIWIYQKNVNGQFEKINTLLSSDGGSIGSRTVFQGNTLVTSGGYVYDITATNHPTSDPTTPEPTAITMTPTTDAPTTTTIAPTAVPSAAPITDTPTESPSSYPSYAPSEPTVAPTGLSISCNDSLTTYFGYADDTTRYIPFILSQSGYDVTFSNCETSYDTRMSVYNDDKSVEVSYDYCDGDDCGYSGFTLCTSYGSNEAFTIPNMDNGTYYIGIRPYSTSYSGDYTLETLCVTVAPTPSPTPFPSYSPTTPFPTYSPSLPVPTYSPVPAPTRATPAIDGEISCNEVVRYNDTQYFQRYYRFVLETTTDVTFSNCDTAYDTLLNVYDHLMVSVSYYYCDGDDCGCSPNEMFSIQHMSAGLYYVETEPFGTYTSIDGPYVLDVSCTSSAPTTAAPTGSPTTAYPTQPTAAPITRAPTEPSMPPTKKPTSDPTTGSPTAEPTPTVDNGALSVYGNVPLCIFVVTTFVILMH